MVSLILDQYKYKIQIIQNAIQNISYIMKIPDTWENLQVSSVKKILNYNFLSQITSY